MVTRRTKQPKSVSADSLAEQLMIPRRTALALNNLEAVKQAFCLPVNASGISEAERLAMDSAFDDMGGFNAIYGSLTQHATELGQYPITSFIGYGALQQVAQQGMIRACIQTVADDMTRKWIELEGCEDVEKLNELTDLINNKYKLKDIFHHAFEVTGYMGGAFVYIKTSVASDEDKADCPLVISDLSAELEKDKYLKFIVVDPVNVSPLTYNCTDPLEDDYMKPTKWVVLGKVVHSSRMLSVVDNEPPLLLKPNYNFLGIPQAQILWDYVMHFNKCRVEAANLLRKVALLNVQTDMDEVLQNKEGVALLDRKMDILARYRDNDSVFVTDKDSEGVQNIQTSIAGCTDVVRQALEMIAAINRTPAVKLLGISPSGFNATGESDIRNYYDYVHSKQELHHEQIQRCIEAIQLVEYGFIDTSINFKFCPLDEENETSKAMTAQTKISALTQLVDRQAMSAEELRQAVKADANLDLSFLSDELPEELQNAESEDFMTDNPNQNTFENLLKQQGNENDKQNEGQNL